MKYVLGLLTGALLLAGCATGSRKSFVDVREPERMSDYQEELWAEGTTLFVQVRQVPGANITKLEPILDGNDLYLEKQVARTGGSMLKQFQLDLSHLDLPRDWTKHVYWVEGRVNSTVTQALLSGNSDAILRRKVTVKTRPETAR
ncbi:MAG: hypothetical protein AB1705_04445 [Verrucomicrobiota bacterium]